MMAGMAIKPVPAQSAPARSPNPAHVKALRSFNRFYTQRIGVLAPYLGSEFSLTEARILYELAHHVPGASRPLTATMLARDLGLDMGYLSRILRRFELHKWVKRKSSPADARQSLLALTTAGYKVFAPLQQRSRDESASLLNTVPAGQQAQVITAMDTLQRLLQPAATAQAGPGTQPAFSLHAPQPGDMGWVVQQHGEIYAREFGWNADFEALVVDIMANCLRRWQADWERCWIAKAGGRRVGSVFVVRKSKTVAQMRMLILTPQARGLGLGAHLTDECIAFARSKGYKKMMLWTNSCLVAARGIYAQRGFKLIKSDAYDGFGQAGLVSETWELTL